MNLCRQNAFGELLGSHIGLNSSIYVFTCIWELFGATAVSPDSLTTPAGSDLRIYRELINADILENTVGRPKSEHTRSKYIIIPDYPDNFLENYQVSFFLFRLLCQRQRFFASIN